MEANATLPCREARGQLATKSNRRSTAAAKHEGGRSSYRDHVGTDDVWSTDASHHVGLLGDKSRSRSADARSRSRCRGCGGSESMETLEVRLLSPDSGAIVFSETPENDLATTVRTAPDSHNQVGIRPYSTSETVNTFMLEVTPKRRPHFVDINFNPSFIYGIYLNFIVTPLVSTFINAQHVGPVFS